MKVSILATWEKRQDLWKSLSLYTTLLCTLIMASTKLHSLLLCAPLLMLASTSAYTPCPLLGPVFEPPSHLASDFSFQGALKSLESTLEKAGTTGHSHYGKWAASTNGFAVGIFDTSSSDQLFSYQFTSKQIKASRLGATVITSDSLFRIGSLSKLITAYLFLIEAGSGYWDCPVTDYVPELATAQHACSATSDPIGCIDWNDVTLGALASHMAGIPRDYSTPAELLDPLDGGEATAVEAGLPPVPSSDAPSCGLNFTDACSETQYLKGLSAEQPVFAPFTTPIYSNAGYELLAFALARIKGKSFPAMLEQSIFAKLGMRRSSYYNPNSTSNAIIPGSLKDNYWAAILGDETPDGGYFSTQSDLVKLGRSILASTLLKPALTRRWMKPVTFTSALNQGVGMPWEIWRVSNLTDHVFDLYTKAGDLPGYSSYLVLSPDYDVGFIVLVAGTDTTVVAEIISDVVANVIFPALETSARQQAQEKYAGKYVNTHCNSSMVLTTQAGVPGITVESWINNSTNMQLLLAGYEGGTSGYDIRLYPTGLKTSSQVAYRAIFESLDTVPDGGVFSPQCTTWETVDNRVYGNVGIDEVVFDLEGGKVTGVTPRAFRTTLKKTS